LHRIKLTHSLTSNDQAEYPAFSTFVSAISPKLRALSIEDIHIDRYVDSFLQGSMDQSLEYLSFDGARISFSSLCSLIKLLPRMSHLSFKHLVCDKQHLDIGTVEFHDHIVSKWSPLSNCLRFCHVSYHAMTNMEELAVYAMLLRIMCSRFTRLVIDERLQSEFSECIEQATSKEPYS
ncbi:hypothetical protein GGI02_006147, partial [Coemansia sp. RSA 2322]